MGKFTYAVLMVFSIEFALWLFAGASYSTTSLFGILSDPSTLLSNPLYLIVILGALSTFALAIAVPIVAGTSVQFNLFALFAGVSAVFITFTMSIVHLWQFLYGELSGITTQLALPITILIVSPILTYYIISTVEWVRSN